jgi:hypothetical protein
MKVSIEVSGFQYEMLKQIASEEGCTVPVVVQAMLTEGIVSNGTIRRQIRRANNGKTD